MRMKPILMSTTTAKALAAGRKTQTRRTIDPQPLLLNDNSHFNYGDEYYLTKEQLLQKSKYQVGDILWVRESVRVGAWREEDGKMAFDYKASPEIKNTPWCYMRNEYWFEKEVVKISDYLSSKGINHDENGYYHWKAGKSPLQWKPSIFMPKEACRFFLEVIDVRAERLENISEEDAVAEGIIDRGALGFSAFGIDQSETAKEAFQYLWENINGDESWDANPWVWVYEFKEVERPKNFLD